MSNIGSHFRAVLNLGVELVRDGLGPVISSKFEYVEPMAVEEEKLDTFERMINRVVSAVLFLAAAAVRFLPINESAKKWLSSVFFDMASKMWKEPPQHARRKSAPFGLVLCQTAT